MPSTVATGREARLQEDLAAVRQRTLDLIAHLSTADLERVIDPILSPLVWDLGHIAAYEDLWCVHRHDPARPPLLHAGLAGHYDAFETPRAVRGDLRILGHAGALDYLAAVRERTLDALERLGAGDGFVHEMVLRHELQHTETMRQAMATAGLLGEDPPAQPPAPPSAPDGPAWARIPGSTHALGAADGVFAYDNERPRHAVDVPPFRIARRPVTNASWLTFAEGGGYVRREWWSDEGWAWKEEYDITHHAGVAAGAPDAPVCHVSWFEADAFARAHDARLPTEAEWEKAATSDQLDVVGAVWEWTSTEFHGYPGFAAHPYREYSEVFFDRGYRVLRGGSWATDPRVATRTFRNWDLPERRQIFSGVRLARPEED
jgi:gamma-glutamyl hercynylcysteine S-oxide synthase